MKEDQNEMLSKSEAKRLAERKAELEKELIALRTAAQEVTGTDQKDTAVAAVNKLYTDKRAAEQSEFSKAGNKTAGKSQGYTATKLADGKTAQQNYMLKSGSRSQKKLAKDEDRSDLINEFVMAPLYQRLLYDRAPAIGLVTKKGEIVVAPGTSKVEKLAPNPTEEDLYISSKFLGPNFKTLEKYLSEQVGYATNISGFEKVIAACLMNGETDDHAGNIGVVKDTNQPDKYIAVKIDHGKSGARLTSTLDALTKQLHKFFDSHKYREYADHFKPRDKTKIMPFNLKVFKDHINEMLKVTKDEMHNMFANRLDLLAKAGVDFSNNKFLYFIDCLIDNEKKIPFEVNATTPEGRIKQLTDLYVKNAMARQDIMRQFVQRLDIISKLSDNNNQLPAKIEDMWFSLVCKDSVEYFLRSNNKISFYKSLNTWEQALECFAKAYDLTIEGKSFSDWQKQQQQIDKSFKTLLGKTMFDAQDQKDFINRITAAIEKALTAQEKQLDDNDKKQLNEFLGDAYDKSLDKFAKIRENMNFISKLIDLIKSIFGCGKAYGEAVDMMSNDKDLRSFLEEKNYFSNKELDKKHNKDAESQKIR